MQLKTAKPKRGRVCEFGRKCFFFPFKSPLGASRAACTASVPVVALFLDMPSSFIAIS